MSETIVPPVRRGRLLVVVLAVLLVAALVALGLVARAWKHEHDLRTAGDQAERAARSAVISMTSYDYRTLDKDFAWVDDAGTDRFRKHYAQVSAPVKKLVIQMKASAHGSVVAAAAQVKDTSHVTVLMFVDQTLTNPGQAQKGLDQPRVTMKMVKQDGHWLVDDVALNNLSAN
jgi:Mce-associated membrane protein